MSKFCFAAFVLLLAVSAVSAFSVNKLQDGALQASTGCTDTDPCTNGGSCDNGSCKCLNGTSGNRCQVIENCAGQYQIWDTCGYVYGVKCEYNQTSQTHYCACQDEKEAYDTELRKCRKKCEGDDDCRNGAKCVDSLCRCLPGTKEDKCDAIVKCRTRSDVDEMCGGPLTRCLYNQTSHLPYCTCVLPKEYGYDAESKQCLECQCGYKSSGCKFEKGKKICNCDWGYAQTKEGKCEVAPCDCGPHGSCHFEGWNTVCDCYEGFHEVNGKCEDGTIGVTDDSSLKTSLPTQSTKGHVSDATDETSTEPTIQRSSNSKSWRTGTIVLGIFLAIGLIGLVAIFLKLRPRQ